MYMYTNVTLIVFSPPDQIYYHRELLCESLDRNRIDLITISDCSAMQGEEPRFDPKLFPDKETPRCKAFKDKRVGVHCCINSCRTLL